MKIPFEPWHLTAMTFQKEQAHTLETTAPLFGGLENFGIILDTAAFPDNEGTKCAWSYMHKGYIYAVGGIVAAMPHVGEAWVFLDRRFFELPRKVILQIVSEIEWGLNSVSASRIQATTEVDFLRGQRFLERLGFEEEGLLKKYGYDGKDHIRYAIVR